MGASLGAEGPFVTWVGVGHVWQARLMRWLLIIIEMLINEQMIYNHHTVTKQ